MGPWLDGGSGGCGDEGCTVADAGAGASLVDSG